MKSQKTTFDVIIIGAGAAGLMAAITAGQRGKKALLIEHTGKIGEKIRISGGGRCNFTNLHASPANYICKNPHFMKSALANYTQDDFIDLVKSHNIAYHEKTLGQLFCDGSSKQIVQMLTDLCAKNMVEIRLDLQVTDIAHRTNFELQTQEETFTCEALIIATGGLSIPKMGATDFGYRVARKFGLRIIPPRPALVPLTVGEKDLPFFSSLSGVSNDALVTYQKTSFRENILFTHRGLSGPAILQISSYLEKFKGEEITLNLLPDLDLKTYFTIHKNNKQTPANYLKTHLTNRLVDTFATNSEFHKSITDLKKDTLMAIADQFHNFKVRLSDSEGYQKAEVTAGGLDTDELSSKTMECKRVPGLFFIGEVVDVTGWLGGYNFQWAWSSGYAAGSYC